MDMLQQPYVQALARALGHFLWQGAAIGFAMLLIVRIARPGAHARYLIGVASLAAMFVAPIATTMWIAGQGSGRYAFAPGGAAQAMYQFAASTSANDGVSAVSAAAGWNVGAMVLVAWIVGVAILSLRMLGGWVVTRRLVRRAQGLSSTDLRGLAQRVAGRLALDRLVDVLESPAIAVPVMIGWLKPVVILPTAAIAGLTPIQIEALIAHELAHVRRHDYLVNLLQSAVETLLFYHPAVWWVSRDVREAREQCCDDLAVGVCDRVVYASALADLATLAMSPRFALAATDGSLVERIRRILGQADQPKRARPTLVAAFLLAVVAGGILPIALASAPARDGAQAPVTIERSTEPVQEVMKPTEVVGVAVEQGKPSVGVAFEAPQAQIVAEQKEQARAIDQDEWQARVEQLRRMLVELQAALARLDADSGRSADELKSLDESRQKVKNALADLEAKRTQKQKELSDTNLEQLAELKAKIVEANRKQDALSLEDAKLAREKLADLQSDAYAKAQRAEMEKFQKLTEANADAYEKAQRADMEKVFAAQQKDIAAKYKLALAYNEEGQLELDRSTVEQLSPVLKAERGNVSVVGAVNHGGSFKWESGMMAGPVIERAGLKGDRASLDFLIVRSINFSSDGSGRWVGHVSVDHIDWATPLHDGDVIVVKKKTEGSNDGGVN